LPPARGRRTGLAACGRSLQHDGSQWTWIVIAAVAVFAIVRLSPSRERGTDAVATLDQRLARGEIDADEYTSRRKLILSH
jgi:hypothetical protein